LGYRVPNQGHKGAVRHECRGHRQLPAGGPQAHGCGQGSRSHCGYEQVSVGVLSGKIISTLGKGYLAGMSLS